MSSEPTTTFQDLNLRDEIMRAIVEAGYTTPTAIQARAIPEVLAGRNVVGLAQTGTGKTASFVLPMLHILANGRARARMPRSLILSPTRELATQTARNFEIYGKHLNLSMALLIGGVGMGDQEKALDKGVDVLIATPGRLLDWFDRGKVLLGGINVLVIDEADRMLDMGFIPDVERIIQLLTGRRQTLLFSATMPKEVRRLAERFLTDPTEITVARASSLTDTVQDVLVPVGGLDKRKALERLLKLKSIDKAIVFCNRKRDVGTLTRHLQKRGFNAKDIHGDLDQSQRQATLDAFKAGTVDLLIATDVAARGLDVVDMPFVVNLDVPIHAEDYVHRIGRTGRAGRQGHAFTLATETDAKAISAIEKLTERRIERLELPGESAPEAQAATDTPAPDKPKPVRARRSRAKSAPALPDSTDEATPAPAEAARPADIVREAVAERPVPEETAPEVTAKVETVKEERVEAPPRARGRAPSRRQAAPASPPSPRRGRGGHREEVEDAPVVAFGDHMPAFMRFVPLPLKGAA